MQWVTLATCGHVWCSVIDIKQFVSSGVVKREHILRTWGHQNYFVSNLYNLRRSRDCLLLGSSACLDVFVSLYISSSLNLDCFGQLLRCADKRIVNIMRENIERNNLQVELIRFRKKIST